MKLMKCLIIFHTTVFCKNFLIKVEDDPKKAKELSSAEMFEAELSTSYEEEEEEEEDKEEEAASKITPRPTTANF